MLDTAALEKIKQILQEYQEEMNNFESKKEGTFHYVEYNVIGSLMNQYIIFRGSYRETYQSFGRSRCGRRKKGPYYERNRKVS